MYCFVISNEETGEIEHCFVDNGNDLNEKFDQMLEEGDFPITADDLEDNFFYAKVPQEDILEALSDKRCKRFTNNKDILKYELEKTNESEFDACRIREEIKVFKKKTQGRTMPKRAKNNRLYFEAEIEARPFRAKTNEITGRIIEDIENYDAIVAKDREELEKAEKAAKQLELNPEKINILKELIKEDLIKEIKEEARKEIIEEIRQNKLDLN